MTLLSDDLPCAGPSVALSACVPGGGERGTAGDASGPAMAPGETEVTALPAAGERAEADGGAGGTAAADARRARSRCAIGGACRTRPAARRPRRRRPSWRNPQTQIACEKGGAPVRRVGTSELRLRPAHPDGGKRCNRESQCDGVCLARSRTCSPFKPLFGCNEILQDNGARVTLCVE